MTLIGSTHDCILAVSGKDLENYKDKLAGKITVQEKIIKQIEKRLSNKAYVSNAPAKLVDASKQQLQEARQLMKDLVAEQGKRF